MLLAVRGRKRGRERERDAFSRFESDPSNVFNMLNWNINDSVGGKFVEDAVATRNIAFNFTAAREHYLHRVVIYQDFRIS